MSRSTFPECVLSFARDIVPLAVQAELARLDLKPHDDAEAVVCAALTTVGFLLEPGLVESGSVLQAVYQQRDGPVDRPATEWASQLAGCSWYGVCPPVLNKVMEHPQAYEIVEGISRRVCRRLGVVGKATRTAVRLAVAMTLTLIADRACREARAVLAHLKSRRHEQEDFTVPDWEDEYHRVPRVLRVERPVWKQIIDEAFEESRLVPA